MFENQQAAGYVTEKILNAYLGGAVPVYFGTEEIFSIFHKDSFVFFNVSDPEPSLSLLRHLHKNETAYHEMIQRPVFADGSNTIRDFFSYDESIGGGKMKTLIRDLAFRQK